MARAYAVRRQVLNAYLVRDRDRRRLRELAVVVLLLLPVGLCGLGYVWLRLEVLRVGYRVHELEELLNERQQEERRLGLEASRLSRPDHVEDRAVTELGMQVPVPGQLIALEDNR